MPSEWPIVTYRRTACATFRKTREEFGGYSNFAGGFPLEVNGVAIRTSEALYQACRFPHLPEVQAAIIEQKNPFHAKLIAKARYGLSRPDWEAVRVEVMRWCLRVKLAQHRSTFGALLLASKERPIVEDSHRDDFWGAVPVDDETLVGRNVLGALLTELREELKASGPAGCRCVPPPDLPRFRLYEREIRPVEAPIGA